MIWTPTGMMHPVLAENLEDTNIKDNLFRAVYFPYARSFNEIFLKQSLLVFDELWFLDPLDRNTRSLLCHYREDGLSSFPKWSTFIDIYDELYDAKFIRLFNDFKLVRDYDNLLMTCLESDIANPDFLSIIEKEVNRNNWGIHPDRLSLENISIPQRFRVTKTTSKHETWFSSPIND